MSLDRLLAALWTLPFAQAALVVCALNVVVFWASLLGGWAAGRVFARRRVAPEPPPIGALELALSGICVLLNGAVAVAGLVLWRGGYLTLRPDEPLRVVRDVVVLFLVMDLGMYVTHRLAHHRLLFALVHATHHRYDRPRPLTLFVLNPFEVLGFGALWLAVLLVYPASPLGILIFLFLNVLFGVVGHLGVEPLPSGWVRWPLARSITTSTFHAVHHRDAEHNFGFYTLIWDRLLGTVAPGYVRTFTAAGRGSGPYSALLLSLSLGLVIGAAACSKRRAPEVAMSQPALDGALLDEVRAQRSRFRAQQDGFLRSELSPLGRVGFLHLGEGKHALVRDGATSELRLLPAADATGPAVLGWFQSDPAQGAIQLLGQSELRMHGAAVIRPLHNQDVLSLGENRLLVVGLPEDPSLAVYDLNSPIRRAYKGLHYYPDDDRYVVRARLTRHAAPRSVRLSASRGEPKKMLALGTLSFSVLGTPATMEAYAEGEDPSRLFLLFRDQTSGKPGGSYGAGRFLTTTVRSGDGGDEVILDFNQAWNPLCAYSVYFHCPLPPRENWLQVELPAGEKAYAEH